MDLGIKIFYLVSLSSEGEKSTAILDNIHHELSKSSVLFYYLDTTGINFKDLINNIQNGTYFNQSL